MATRVMFLLLLGALVINARAAMGADCEAATTTREMSSCLQAELREQEKNLGELHARLESALKPEERLLYQQAQLAWSSFQLANCNSARSLFAGGTMAPVVFVQCKVETTEQRIRDLRKIYETRLQ